MNAEIIAVGSELLLGQIVNSNAQFISKELAEIGVNVFFHTVVGDNGERLEKVIKQAEERSSLLIFTGGLGPTKDDLTKETVAKHLGTTLTMDDTALSSIQAYFTKRGMPLTENNKKQALILDGSASLLNEHGMAPGMVYTTSTHTYMLLPGPPSEMQPMFVKYGIPALLTKMDSIEGIHSRVLRYFGIGEAQLETEIEDLLEVQTNPTIAPLASDGEVTLRITAKHASRDVAEKMIDEVEKQINDRVGYFCYGKDQTSLMNEVVKKLMSQNKTLACAESLTGGMFQQYLTDIPGVSQIFKGGIVSYSNEAKAVILQVKEETIENYGVVSEQCAKEMAEQVQRKFDADFGISFTGVAGPDEQEGKPVGTVFVGLAERNHPTKVVKLQFGSKSRKQNRIRAVKNGCSILLRHLNE